MKDKLKFEKIYSESRSFPAVIVPGTDQRHHVQAGITIFHCPGVSQLLVERIQWQGEEDHPNLTPSGLATDTTRLYISDPTSGRLLRHCATLADEWFAWLELEIEALTPEAPEAPWVRLCQCSVNFTTDPDCPDCGGSAFVPGDHEEVPA